LQGPLCEGLSPRPCHRFSLARNLPAFPVSGVDAPHQATLIGPGARSRLSPLRPQAFRLSADLDYFLQLCRDPQLRVQTLDLELVHMALGGVSGVQHRRRLQEVRRAYQRAFGCCWPFPYLLRYAQRFLSALA